MPLPPQRGQQPLDPVPGAVSALPSEPAAERFPAPAIAGVSDAVPDRVPQALPAAVSVVLMPARKEGGEWLEVEPMAGTASCPHFAGFPAA